MRFLLTDLLVALASPDQASMRTDQLLWQCQGTDPMPDFPEVGQAICTAYISSFIDAITVAQKFTGYPFFCLLARGISN